MSSIYNQKNCKTRINMEMSRVITKGPAKERILKK